MTPKEVAVRIDAAGTAIEAELGTMSDELASWHPAAGEWCVKEVLAHLTLSEAEGFAGRRSVELVANLKPWDLDRAGIHERVGRLTVNELLHEWVHHDRAHFRQILANVQGYVCCRWTGPRPSFPTSSFQSPTHPFSFPTYCAWEAGWGRSEAGSGGRGVLRRRKTHWVQVWLAKWCGRLFLKGVFTIPPPYRVDIWARAPGRDWVA